MQVVYSDGSLGIVQEFEETILKQLLSNTIVDHVRVFNIDNGNKVGVPVIEEKVLEILIEKKLEERSKKIALYQDYTRLTAEFDRRIK